MAKAAISQAIRLPHQGTQRRSPVSRRRDDCRPLDGTLGTSAVPAQRKARPAAVRLLTRSATAVRMAPRLTPCSRGLSTPAPAGVLLAQAKQSAHSPQDTR
mgnify:CR=1 FL=1